MILFCNLGLFVPCAPIITITTSTTIYSPKLPYASKCLLLFQPNKPRSFCLRDNNMGFTFSSLYRRSISSYSWVASRHVAGTFEQNFNGDMTQALSSTEDIQLDCHSSYIQNSASQATNTETTRRRKIGIANKGKVPWNKGRKHSAETRERIRERTKEALKDPKIRQKISECPRAHSNQTKARIRTSLRQLWAERLKWKRSGEKFLLSWASGIAKAAKTGGTDQQELDWDSYEKTKSEIAFQQRQWAVYNAKAKEVARIRGQRAAQAKAEKLVRLAERRKEREEKEKVKGELKKRAHKKSKEEIEQLAVARELKLKEKLAKIHRKKSKKGQVSNLDRAWERFDLELVKSDQVQKEVSLADQIQAVKNIRDLIVTYAGRDQ